MQTPDETLANRERVREFSDWIDRADYAEKVLEAAAWLGNDLGLLDSMAGMKSAPSVSDATAAIATHVAPGPDEDPVTATAGTLRVAARFTRTPVDRRNSGTDGRIALARMVGAEDRTSDNAFLALIEIAEAVCLTSKPACNLCPLREHCRTAE
jgi:DNA (cytosine-5)-methyltransferase 1